MTEYDDMSPAVADRIEALTAERDALAEKLERAVEALGFYANDPPFAGDGEWPFLVIDVDEGVVARTTLAAIQEKTDD